MAVATARHGSTYASSVISTAWVPTLARYWKSLQARPSFAVADIWTRPHVGRLICAPFAEFGSDRFSRVGLHDKAFNCLLLEAHQEFPRQGFESRRRSRSTGW